jgi:signal transduction histidine kinase
MLARIPPAHRTARHGWEQQTPGGHVVNLRRREYEFLPMRWPADLSNLVLMHLSMPSAWRSGRGKWQMQQAPSLRTAMFPGVGRLRFADDLEPSFAEYHAEHSLPVARLGLVLAVLLYALFGVLDLFVAPDVAGRIWVIRYAIFCPAALAVLGLTFTRWFKPIMQPALSAVAALAGLGIVAMIAIASPAIGHLYYAGLMLVVPWVYTVLQLRFSYAAKACLAIMIGYEAVAIWLKSTPADILVNDNFFFLSAVIIGMVAGYTMERGLRTDFLQRRVIESQQAELAAHNAQLGSALDASVAQLRRQAAELQASRTRIVAAADSERRRIERNLHDGAQQRLSALAIKLSLVSELAGHDLDQARDLLAELRGDVRETAEELRCLAHGIYPPLLAESGLAAALSSAARHSTLPVTVQAPSQSRYPAQVEATIYFCCLEAIQNACKHAGDQATLRVRIWEEDSALTFDVSDDGAGFDAAGRGLGAGFVNMEDRLRALRGSLRVESAPGRGTQVTGTVPVAAAVNCPA